MSFRFLTNTALMLLGGFLVVVSLAWVPSVFMWLMFAGGIAAVVLATAAALPGRGLAQRSLDGVLLILGAWTIVASLVFAGSTITWLGFASACGFVALALIGLGLHEVSTERVVHSLEISGVSTAQHHNNERRHQPVH